MANINDDLLDRANRAVRAALGESRAVASIDEWGGGAHNRGYQLHLNDGTRLFWKVENENIFPRTRRGQVEREVTGIRLASQAGVDCPQIVGHDTTGQVAGCRYLLEEFIDRPLLGEVMQPLSEDEQAALFAQFKAEASKLQHIRGSLFGEIYPGGPVGQYATWREMTAAFSTLLLEDAATLGCYSTAELALVQRAHAAALDEFRYQGTPAFVHLDLHIFNAFSAEKDGAPAMGKLFDFGLCLYLAPYVIHYNEKAFDGQEARLAQEYGVSEAELGAFHLLYRLEFINFISTIHWAPDQPYGYLAQMKDYLQHCEAYA